MTETRLVIVVSDQEAATAYAGALGGAAVAFDIVPSFKEMALLAMARPYNGLIIDVLTLVRSSKEEKVIAYDCINLFPVLRVKREITANRVRLVPLEHEASQGVEAALRSFIETRCRSFPPRMLRRHKRSRIHLGVLLSRDRTFPEDVTEKTFTVTLSQGGAFVYTMRGYAEGERLWLRFAEMPETAVPVMVRWSLKWGVARAIPGIGVSFEELSASQQKEIEKVLN